MTQIAVIALLLAAYALVSKWLDRRWISAPMVFLIAGVILGPNVAGVIDTGVDAEAGLTLTEVTLALLLFADASTVPLRSVEADAGVPSRLLLFGLPLTMLAGALVARLLFPDLGWAEVALLAAILAPTDAALGMAVVTNRAVPVRIRRALNVESGLNDGITTPFVTLFITLIATEEGIDTSSFATEAVTELGLAVVVAVVVGSAAGWLIVRANDRGWTSAASEQLGVLAIALLAYSGSVMIGGNGFVAAFLGGLIFGYTTKGRMHAPTEFTESLSVLLSLLVWLVFGATLVSQSISAGLDPVIAAYAVLSLTLVRMLPVAIALARSRFHASTVAFIGWFGPRGLASVVFTLMAQEALDPGSALTQLTQAATWTVVMSVFAHGLSAMPLSGRYGRAIARYPGTPELADAPEPKVRRRTMGSTDPAG